MVVINFLLIMLLFVSNFSSSNFELRVQTSPSFFLQVQTIKLPNYSVPDSPTKDKRGCYIWPTAVILTKIIGLDLKESHRSQNLRPLCIHSIFKLLSGALKMAKVIKKTSLSAFWINDSKVN